MSAPRLVGIFDLEVVEVPGGAVAAEVGDVDAADAGLREQVRDLRAMEVAQLLLDHVGAEAGDRAADVDVRLVHRVAQRVAGVAEHHDRAGLRHERAHVADRALDHDRRTLQGDAAARGGVTADVQQAAVGGGAGRLAGVAVDDHAARHHVLRQALSGVAGDAHGGALVHARAVVAGVPLDHDLDVGVEAAGDVVDAGRVDDPPAPRAVGRFGEVVETLVEVAQRGLREIDDLGGGDVDGHQTRTPSQMYGVAGAGSQIRAVSAPGSTAMARNSEDIATQSSVSAITAGLQAI